VFQNPDWDYRKLNFDSDISKADERDHGLLNATDPNLKTFFERGAGFCNITAGTISSLHLWAAWTITRAC
jgi:hypothetical protein